MLSKFLGRLLKLLFPGWATPETSPLFKAIENRDFPEVKALLENGADVNCADETGKTALMLAVSLPENYDMAKFLINCGADVLALDKDGKSVLDYVFEPEEPPENHENAYEAWIHCEEHYLRSYLHEMIEEKKALLATKPENTEDNNSCK